MHQKTKTSLFSIQHIDLRKERPSIRSIGCGHSDEPNDTNSNRTQVLH
jgi:hypothetical protein